MHFVGQLLFWTWAFYVVFWWNKKENLKKERELIKNGWVKQIGFDDNGKSYYYWQRPQPKSPKPTGAPAKQKK